MDNTYLSVALYADYRTILSQCRGHGFDGA